MPWKFVPRPGGLRALAELGAPVPGAALREGGEQASGRVGKGSYCSAAWAQSPARRLRAGRQQAAGSWAAGKRRTRLQPRSRPWALQPVPGSRGKHCGTCSPAPLCSAMRGYFFLGKKLNLFSLSFLLRLASGPVMEGRGRL